MTSKLLPLITAGITAAGLVIAQVPDSQSSGGGGSHPAPASSSGGGGGSQGGSSGNSGGSSFLGKDVPFFDPGSEIVTWDGKSWNISDNRLFEARFEKYLNAPEETQESNRAYSAILQQILDKLAPATVTEQSTVEAFQLLSKAAQYDADAHLCDTLAEQVYSAWLAIRANDRLEAANTGLAQEKKTLEWNSQMTAQDNQLDSGPGGKDKATSAEWAKNQDMRRDAQMQPIVQRLAEVNALLKANELKSQVQQLQVKIDFQALMVQFFMQRRFQHVLMATRFYRSIFNDGDSQLRVGKDAQNLFASTSGMPPTVNTMDGMANEALHDVHESVQAFYFLLGKNELDSATKRLAEAFLIGEYTPDIQMIDRDKKRQALLYVQKSNQLISAIEVKDYSLAEKLTNDLTTMANDFDSSKPLAAIETAKTVSAMHIAKAKNAAVSGDKVTLESELTEATEIWPRNPALVEVSSMIFQQGDVQQRAIVDFDQLLSQKNYRQIYDDKMRFIAAVATMPEKQAQLQTVLNAMTEIESAIIRSQEIEKRGDYAGAWESAETAFQKYPEDNKLNQVRADLTTKAPDFVHALEQAEELEKESRPGSSLAWYLKAQKEYPDSEFARDGIERVTKQILPDAS